MNTFDIDRTYVAGTYNRAPVEIVGGKGALLEGADGRQYIDMGSGIAVNGFGLGDETWKEAVIAQLNRVQHASNLYYTSPQALLAKALCQKTGMKKVFFGNSGAEANECAIKVMRKYASDKYGEEKRPVIVTLVNSFHGRTLATLAATGQDHFHHSFGPFPAGFRYVQSGDSDGMREALAQGDVAGVMMEMVQGEGGVIPLDRQFVQETVRMAAECGALVAVDEVQTGNGRSGTYFSYEQFGIQPDVVTTAKGLGGGLPIGACLIGEKAQDTLTPGSHGSTFGGNPVVCAGALTIVRRIDEGFLAGVRVRSDLIRQELEGAKGITGVTGMGLMLGVETEKPAPEVLAACRDRGVLVLTAKTKIRLLPPLNIDIDLLKKAVDAIKEAAK